MQEITGFKTTTSSWNHYLNRNGVGAEDHTRAGKKYQYDNAKNL